VLVARFVVVVERTDPRLLLVFDYFFFQNFKFKFHEVNLLLEVYDVLILKTLLVGVLAELVLIGFVLTTKLHLHCGLISGILFHRVCPLFFYF